MTIGREGDDVIVLGALEGFAFDAGVRPGDHIVRIDGTDTRDKPLDQVDPPSARLAATAPLAAMFTLYYFCCAFGSLAL